MFGWFSGSSSGSPDREKQKQVTTQIASSKQQEHELGVRRVHLTGRLEDIKQEILALDADDEEKRVVLFEEYEQTQAQVEELDSLLGNIRVTNSALSSAAINKGVFDSQQGAVDALQTVNGQLKETDVERVNMKLQHNIDKNRAVSNAMTKPLKVRPAVKKPTNTRSDRMEAQLAKWNTSKFPNVGATGAGAGNSGSSSSSATTKPKITESNKNM